MRLRCSVAAGHQIQGAEELQHSPVDQEIPRVAGTNLDGSPRGWDNLSVLEVAAPEDLMVQAVVAHFHGPVLLVEEGHLRRTDSGLFAGGRSRSGCLAAACLPLEA